MKVIGNDDDWEFVNLAGDKVSYILQINKTFKSIRVHTF